MASARSQVTAKIGPHKIALLEPERTALTKSDFAANTLDCLQRIGERDMRELLVQAWVLGSDSLIAGLLAGSVIRTWRCRIQLAVLFGIADGLGTLCGAFLSHSVPSLPDIVVYFVCVALVALAARSSSFWLFFMPLILALDNLSSGAPADTAFPAALASALLAMIGLIVSWTIAGRRGDHGWAQALRSSKTRVNAL
jgi:hypothetical protein